MVRDALIVALLVAVGFGAVTNPLWLFPAEGQLEYTHERTEVTVEDGRLAYDGDSPADFDFRNELAGIDCDRPHEDARACAFDRYLRDHGPVVVETGRSYDATPDYTKIDGAYYRRVTRSNGSGELSDVRRVDPVDLLETLASDANDDPSTLTDASRPDYRAAVTGDPQTTLDRPAEDGRTVWVRNGTYYAVVVTEESVRDRPLVSGLTRSILQGFGAVLLFAVVPLRAVGRVDVID